MCVYKIIESAHPSCTSFSTNTSAMISNFRRCPARWLEEREAAECVPVERGGLIIFGVPCEGAVVFRIFENHIHRVLKIILGVGSTVAFDLVRNKFDLHCKRCKRR